jgi:hypothetical protein
MPILANPKHELFAQGRAKGLSIKEAYAKAGYFVDLHPRAIRCAG